MNKVSDPNAVTTITFWPNPQLKNACHRNERQTNNSSGIFTL